jgi:hypothetical protein
VLRGEERLDAATRPEIQRAGDGHTHGELRERHRRRLNAGHPIGRLAGERRTCEIRREVVVAVWNEPHGRSQAVADVLGKAQCQ